MEASLCVVLVPGHVWREGSHALEKVGAVAALDVLHDHAEVLARLEGAEHGHDEGIVGERHDITLGKHLVDLQNHGI